MNRVLVTILICCHSTAYAQKGAFIVEGNYTKSLNTRSMGLTAGWYYKTKWPVALRLAATQTYGGSGEYSLWYIQAGYMQRKNRFMWQAMVGVAPNKYNFAGGVHTIGAGYQLSKGSDSRLLAICQLNLAKNRFDTYSWLNIGVQGWFRGKKKETGKQ